MQTFATQAGVPEAIALNTSAVLEPLRDAAVFVLDRLGRIATWNEGVGAILGWERDEWIGQPLQLAFTPEDIRAGMPEAELHRAAATGRSEDSRWMQRKSGERFYASSVLARLKDAQGIVVGYVKALRDGTWQQQQQAEVSRALLMHDEAVAWAGQLDRALTATIEAVDDGVLICEAQGLLRCNAAALRLLGMNALEDLQNADHWAQKFRLRRERNGVPLPLEQTPLRLIAQGRSDVQDLWVTQPETGVDVFLRCAAAPIVVGGRSDGGVVVISDLEERLQLRQKGQALSVVQNLLQERDAELRALSEGVRDYAIFTLDTAGCVSSWHAGAQLMKGYTADEAIGTHFSFLFTPEDRAAGLPDKELALAARDGEYKCEGQRLRQDGHRFDAAVVLTALRGPRGELLGFLKLTQDISQRRQIERGRETTLAQAQAARSEAERASQAKDDFLATISHELRTPLSAILGWAHVLERGVVDAATVRHGLEAIARNARIQSQLIEDLLDMSRIEAGHLRLDMQRIELAGVIATAIDSCLPAAANKCIGLRTVFSQAGGVTWGDAARLQQVVGNLVSNAIKFTPEGGEVNITLSQHDGQAQIAVADNGQGIAPDFLPHLFDRFQQQDGSRTRRHGGLGLGLSIVRQLVQLHHGSVQAHSAGNGQGATFTVTLPSLGGADDSAGDASKGAVTAPPASDAAVQRLDGVRVLLVDDEADMREVTAQLLKDAGAEVRLASNAESALQALADAVPDVILSDIGMPGVDGYEFMRRLRDLPDAQGGGTPAVAFTAYSRPEDRERAMAAGYQRHLVKPASVQSLLQVLAELSLPEHAGSLRARAADGH